MSSRTFTRHLKIGGYFLQMAKRFTDTDKYKKPFLRAMPGAYKLLWDYICNDCNHAGIWIVDFEIAQMYVGSDMKINKAKALQLFNADKIRVIEIKGGKYWFIFSFIEFQYGILNPLNRAHNSVINCLSSYDLWDDIKNKIKPLTSPLQGAMDKDKEKDMVKDMDQEKSEIVIIDTSVEKNENFIKFQKWIDKNAPRVNKMKEPFTEPQFEAIKSEFPLKDIQELLKAMHNYEPLLKKNINANLTFRNWMKKRISNSDSNEKKYTLPI